METTLSERLLALRDKGQISQKQYLQVVAGLATKQLDAAFLETLTDTDLLAVLSIISQPSGVSARSMICSCPVPGVQHIISTSVLSYP